MAFASDCNLDELMAQAREIVRASKSGGEPLLDLSNLKGTIRQLELQPEIERANEKRRLFDEAWNAGKSWMVSDEVVTAFCNRVSSGCNNYTQVDIRLACESPGAKDGMFHGVVADCQNFLHVGFCSMAELAFIGRIAIRTQQALEQLEDAILTESKKSVICDLGWIKRMQARPSVTFF
jgi:hypothetical protein